MASNLQDLQNRFVFHPVKSESQGAEYGRIRAAGLELACLIDDLCPNSREKSLAFTKIEEAIMWANAAKARHE